MSYEERLRERQNQFTRRLSEELGKGGVAETIKRVAAELAVDGEQALEWLSLFVSRPAGWKVADEQRGRILKVVGRLFLNEPCIADVAFPAPTDGAELDSALACVRERDALARELIAGARLIATQFGLKSWPDWLTARSYDEPDWAYPIFDGSGAPVFPVRPMGYPEEGGLQVLPLHPDVVFRDALQIVSTLEPHDWWVSKAAHVWRDDSFGGVALSRWAREYVAGERDVDSVDMLVPEDFFRSYDVPADVLRSVQPKLRRELRRLRRDYEEYQRGKIELKEEDATVRYWLSLSSSSMRALISQNERLVGDMDAKIAAPSQVAVTLELSVPPLMRNHRLAFTVAGTDKTLTL